MTDETMKREDREAQDEASAPENEAAENTAENEIEKLHAQVADLEQQLAAANDKYLRMIAEYDNYRKRSTKERENIYTDAVADTVENILPIGDNLARAAQFTDPESVSKGIAMMEKSFVEALGKMGITEIEAKDQPFDPELHSAVMHVEDENVGENTVVEVFQKGYRRGDKIIRYAMVKVAN